MLRALLAPPLCWSCHAPAARGTPLCRTCRRALRFLPRAPVKLGGGLAHGSLAGGGLAVWAPVAYEGPARELVKGLKFHGATAIAASMAALVVAGAPEALLAGAIVPVPLHPGRRRSRGFNQAELLAREIAARAGLPLADCLTRSGPSRRQVGRGRAARLAGPVAWVEPTREAPVHATLVDDVVTTGGTLAACAAALRAAGAQRVTAVAFARTAGR